MAPMQSTLGDYRIVARIDEGGMGAVYRARHASLGHEVAIKVLPTTLASDPDAQQWFRRGAASAAALQHPNILPVYHYGEQDGAPYLVMPYVAGGTLKDRIARGQLPFGEIVRVMEQLGAALDFAHSQGVIHRDVKPANLLLDERGILYLADFGIAKALETATKFTRTGTTIGTPEYMAPEQARGLADHRADLYAAGIILYQLLTGQVPFSGDSAVEILMQHVQDPPPLAPVRAARPSLPPAIEPVLGRALAKDPNARYQRAADLVVALAAALAAAPHPPGRVPGHNTWSPDNQATIVAPRTPTSQPVATPTTGGAGAQLLATTPTPYPVQPTPQPVAPYAPQPVTPTPIQAPPARRNPLIIGLSVALAASLLLCSVAGVGAWAVARPEATASTKTVAVVDPTATPAPTNTPQPIPTAIATRTPAPTATPRPPTATATPRQPTPTPTDTRPRGTAPQGWQTFNGAQYGLAVAFYYPPGWTVEPTSTQVQIVSPDRQALFAVFNWGPQPTGTHIDGLRDRLKTNIYASCNTSQTCNRVTDAHTTEDVKQGTTFAAYYSYLDSNSGSRWVDRSAVGLLNGVAWVYEYQAPNAGYTTSEKTYFEPIFYSLNFYQLP